MTSTSTPADHPVSSGRPGPAARHRGRDADVEEVVALPRLHSDRARG